MHDISRHALAKLQLGCMKPALSTVLKISYKSGSRGLPSTVEPQLENTVSRIEWSIYSLNLLSVLINNVNAGGGLPIYTILLYSPRSTLQVDSSTEDGHQLKVSLLPKESGLRLYT